MTILNPPRRTPASPIQTTGPFAVQSSEKVLSDAEYQRVTAPNKQPRSHAWNGTPRRMCMVDDNAEPMSVDDAAAMTGVSRSTIYGALCKRGQAKNGGREQGHRFVWAA